LESLKDQNTHREQLLNNETLQKDSALSELESCEAQLDTSRTELAEAHTIASKDINSAKQELEGLRQQYFKDSESLQSALDNLELERKQERKSASKRRSKWKGKQQRLPRRSCSLKPNSMPL